MRKGDFFAKENFHGGTFFLFVLRGDLCGNGSTWGTNDQIVLRGEDFHKMLFSVI